MDEETLTNHISRLGKDYFNKACKLVFVNVFDFTVINVDGKSDGGTDWAKFDRSGARTPIAYQATTQKTDLKNKAYRDAKKAIEELGVERYFFCTTYIMNEIELRKQENEMVAELGIPCSIYDAKTIAGLILSEHLLTELLQEINYPFPDKSEKKFVDYFDMTLHGYTIFSDDSSQLKQSIYDDTILFLLSDRPGSSVSDLSNQVSEFLQLPEEKETTIEKRIGALFGRQLIRKETDGRLFLVDSTIKEILSRKKVYQLEMDSLVSAQADMFAEQGVEWNLQDSRRCSVWIVEAFINQQFSNLRDIKASLVIHPIFENINNNGVEKMIAFLEKTKKIDHKAAQLLTEKNLSFASSHPLISKLVRASMYLALRGRNPISSAKALGAGRWSDFKMIIEPSTGIPFLCSLLFDSEKAKQSDITLKAINRASKLGVSLHVPYFYINECAGHLLGAIRYTMFEVDHEELQYSRNAFVSTFYRLKKEGVKTPEKLLDYLALYSPAVRISKQDYKLWVREVMIDIQSLFNKSQVAFLDMPFLTRDEKSVFYRQYSDYLLEHGKTKPGHLVDHDVAVLQCTNNDIVAGAEHWIILTFDKSLVDFGKTDTYKGWVTSPHTFLDITNRSTALSENQYISLLHNVATFSERTLSLGARIIDRILVYANNDFLSWEFKAEIEKFRSSLLSMLDDLPDSEIDTTIDQKTDEFLRAHGVAVEDQKAAQI